ncbi:hypothetical protein Aph01nite_15070 [Acrocarpospora phusangensis]|uniref:Glycoprotein n=1 Tax=Acrocarpospora phusangensis TaxID=1070424 RepID=A0A919Q6H6_9ACTN|nr:DUF6049 family protein [Acrocarpospora phusangensis]GIH23197.1 hypothetical protein Aph01nite_15070 [Acrocarpospora phusangensis]
MRRLVSLLTAAWLVAPGLAHPASARASVLADALVVTEISPEAPTDPRAPITISGEVTGTPRAPIKVRFRYGLGGPFQSRADMDAHATGQADYTSGFDTRIQGGTALDAAGKLSFTVDFTPAQLGLIRAGVYPLTIEALDGLTEQPLSAVRTFLTYLPAGTQIGRTRIAAALPLVGRQHQADDSVFMNEDLLGDGRLAGLRKLAETVDGNVTWFVDPALLDDAHRLSQAHRNSESGDELDRSADAEAGAWLEGVRAALTDNPVVATPYGDADLTALVHNGLDDATGQAVSQGSAIASQLLKRQIPSNTVWPVGGVIDRDALDELAISGARSVLLTGSALPPVNPAEAVTAAPAAPVDTVNGQLTAQLADPVLSQLLSTDTRSPGAALTARQRFVAETAMISLSQPPKRVASVIVAPPARLWNPDPDFVAGLLKPLPWTRSVRLDSIKPDKTARGDLVYSPQARQGELSKAYMTTLRKLSRKVDTATQVPTSGVRVFETAVLRLASAAWRGQRNEKEAAAYVAQVERAVDERIAKVSVARPEDPRSIAGENGRIPVTVKNDMAEDAKVAIRVRSSHPQLLAVEARDGVYQTDTVVVPGGKTQSFDVPVTVRGDGGQATLNVQLVTPQGRVFGKAAKLTVSATGYGGIALVIVGAAVVIMLAAVVMRVLRRRSTKRPILPSPIREPSEA